MAQARWHEGTVACRVGTRGGGTCNAAPIKRLCSIAASAVNAFKWHSLFESIPMPLLSEIRLNCSQVCSQFDLHAFLNCSCMFNYSFHVNNTTIWPEMFPNELMSIQKKMWYFAKRTSRPSCSPYPYIHRWLPKFYRTQMNKTILIDMETHKEPNDRHGSSE